MSRSDELKKARDLLKSGNIEESLKIIRKLSDEISGYLGICPGCKSEVPVLQKDTQEFSECPKCGALWGRHTVDRPLIKYEGKRGSNMLIKKSEILEKLWKMYQEGEPGVEAYDINYFDATGWLKKSLAQKLQLPMPGETPEGGEDLKKKKYSEDSSDWIGRKIKILMDEGKPQDQAIAIAHEMARDRGMKVPAKKSMWDDCGYGDRLTKEDILDGMLRMIKDGEETQRVNRHTIAKFENTNEIDEDILKAVYKKLGKNFYKLEKKEDRPPKEVEEAVEAKENKNIWKEKQCDICPRCECNPCNCQDNAKKTAKKYGIKKRKGDSDMWDDSKHHDHQRRGALKPILAKEKPKKKR